MAKTEKNTFPKCALGSVVNPGEYWLVSKLETHVEEIKKLEDMLADEMNQTLTLPIPQMLVPQCCVAVESAQTKGNWQRGKLLEKLGKNLYKVFLVDSGHFTNVELRHVQLIENQKYLQVEPLAFRFVLYGVVPFIVADDCKKKVCENWSSSAKEFITNLFSKELSISVEKVHITGRTVFGDLYLNEKPNGVSFSLGKLLCNKEFGMCDESYYKRKVLEFNSSTSSDSGNSFLDLAPDFTTELERARRRVEKWQMSSARYLGCHDDGMKSFSSEISETEDIMSCNFDGERSGPPVTAADARRRQSMNEEVARETFCDASDVSSYARGSAKCRTVRRGTKGSESVVSAREKEFNLVLEDNYCPIFENDSGVEIFTLFSDSVVQPVNKLRNLNVSQNIVLNLEKEGSFSDLSPIQRWAIPSIQRGHNVVMISGPKTGKTLAYLISFLAILQDRLDAEEVVVGNGPVAIILCSGSRSCDNIYYICHLLLRPNSEKEKGQSSVRVKVVYGSSREKRSWVHLTNGCDLLISTPHCLVRLLKHRGITNLERLEYLVLDEVDIIVQEPFLSPVKMILNQSNLSKGCQRVFCGEKWTPELWNLVSTFSKSHAILIGSYLEAAIYARLEPQVLLVDAEKKSQIILDAMRSEIGKSKILIACELTSEVLYLGDLFKTKGLSPLIAHSDMVVHDIKVVERRWKLETTAPIMICSDDVIQRLAIDDADMLIHYNLPHESKTNFGKRFSALMKSFRKCSSQDTAKEATVLILTDVENHYQLPHIVDFVLRLGGKIPEKITEMSREISWRIEVNKKDVPICRDVLEFGECMNARNCRRRHAFIKDVDSAKVPPSGLVKFEVLQVHSVCYLSVRIIEVIDKSGNKTVFENLTGEISDKLSRFYKLEENRAFVGDVEINKLCSVEREDDCGKRFERAKILEFKKWNKLNKVTEVLVKFVDNGQISRVSVYKLFELPEDLKKYIPQATDIFLCGVLPSDFDRSWNEEAIFSAQILFKRPLRENQFWFGRIRLALKDSLHLESVKLCRFLQNVKTYVIDFSVRKKLLSEGIAVENEKHLERLRLLCEKANIEMPCYEGEEATLKLDDVEPQWAYLDGDLPRVEFISAESTSCLFLRMAKFRNLLTKLERECQKVGEEMRMLRDQNKGTDKWTPRVGMYCLALYENAWNRGRIEEIAENDKVLVFFIDYGDSHRVNDLLPIPTALLTQLPAQAIECCLTGVNYDSAPSDKVLGEIYSFSNEGTSDLYVFVIDKSRTSQMTGGWKYEVNLVNADGVSLNRKLVSAELVEAKEDSFHLAVNMDIGTCGLEDEGDVTETLEDEVDLLKESDCEEEESKWVNGEKASLFANISEEMFDDDNAQLMVKEFMEHFFQSGTAKKIENDKKLKVPGRKGLAAKEREAPSTQNEDTTSDLVPERREKREGWCYTPQILWRQDHHQIQIKIVLNNVGRYRLNCSTTHFLFRCLLDEKLYAVVLRLFGSVNPHLTEVRVKPFHVQVTLKKLCPLQWPRLPRDKLKYRWIKFDVEDFAGEQSSYVEGICNKALSEIESGRIKKPVLEKGDIELVPSTDSDERSVSDDAEDVDSFI